MYCYVVKWPVFRLERGSAKSPLAPSVLDLYVLSHFVRESPLMKRYFLKNTVYPFQQLHFKYHVESVLDDSEEFFHFKRSLTLIFSWPIVEEVNDNHITKSKYQFLETSNMLQLHCVSNAISLISFTFTLEDYFE